MTVFNNSKLRYLLLFSLLFLIYCYLYQYVLKVDSTLLLKNVTDEMSTEDLKLSKSVFVLEKGNSSASLPENLKRIAVNSSSEKMSYKKKFVIPPEAYDKKSPFYGMLYKNVYGLPLSAISNKTFKENITDWWGNYFPVLISAIEKDHKQNSNQNKRFFTKTGVLTLHKTNFTINEEFAATITSLDAEGRNRSCGGDHYRARFIRHGDNTTYPDGISCEVYDNNNGSYTVKAPLVLEGLFTFDVKLVNSLQRIKRIINLTSTHCISHNNFLMTLESKEVVLCAVSSECLKGPVCDYSTPWNKAKWVCETPPSGKCSKITYLTTRQNKTKKQRKWKHALKSFVYDVKLPKIAIEVTKPQGHQIHTSLPTCNKLFSRSKLNISTSVTGYFEMGQWKSLICQNNGLKYGFRYIQTCLRNKIVYLLGDSTIRQLFQKLVEKFSLHVVESAEKDAWQQPKLAYDKIVPRHNLTLYFRPHGNPLKNTGPPFTRLFIADVISTIRAGGSSVYVVFTIGLHVHDINPMTFLQRLKYIRIAITRHHKKFPDTKFIIKGMNVVEPAVYWDWPMFRYEIILRNYFKQMNNVLFVNLWDLTTVWPLQVDIHPPTKILDEETLLLFNYMC